ncbi:MAG TPA: SET domain-containing protein-lysine N-methyltransferase [Myxococcota bacterium]|nr:SET domain-containing protein-lysine N-methyltransferase [Myxococcota bacterium]
MSKSIGIGLGVVLFTLMAFSGQIACKDDCQRPTLKTLKHPLSAKFFGRDGIKSLCEKYLCMTYLDKCEIQVDAIKNRTKADLIDPKKYARNERLFDKQVSALHMADIYVKFIDDELGYGVFANSDIKKEALIGEYTGVIELKSNVKNTTWAWSYPSDIYKEELHIPAISVDSRLSGNGMRFVNHSDDPNCEMRRIFLDGYVHSLYVAIKDIAKDQQILISYGSSYWETRKKQDL